ncbi:MAG: extracellular solute-binding protein [Burkholderiales bacterium]|nr:MAG: extracellular solute-binding protein [Burkholderiales bacterium]
MDRRQFVQFGAGLSVVSSGLAQAQSKSVTYVGWSQDEAASKPTLTAMFDGYRKEQADVKLDVVGFPFGQMQQNVLLRLRSNQPLDVVQLTERWLPQFATTGRMLDMNQVFGKATLEKQISPEILKFGEFRGKQLGVPWTAASIGMVANAKVMSDAGVTAPPQTIDAFLSALRAIKRTQPQAVPYALMTKNNNSLSPEFQTWLWTFGGSLFDSKGQVTVNSAAGVRALTFMTDLVREGLAAKDIDRPDARRMYAQNQTGFYNDAPLARGFARNNSGKGTAFDSNVIAMATPVVRTGDTPRAFAWSHLLCMFGTGKAVPNAQSPQAKFISHLAMNPGNQMQYFKEQGLFPVVGSALADLASDAYVSTWSKAARSALRDEISFWPNSADLTSILGEEVQSAMLGQKTPQAAIESMGKRMEAKIAELPKS